MKLRSAVTHWLLALLLLLSQQLAVVHAVSHIADARAHTSQDKRLPADQSCSQCVAFAQIGTALTGADFVFHDVGVNDAARIPAPDHDASAAAFLAFRSRAPPVFA